MLWVGVKCEPDVAEARERSRGDRTSGMARHQAIQVHMGTEYDVAVDTTGLSTSECADLVVETVDRVRRV